MRIWGYVFFLMALAACSSVPSTSKTIEASQPVKQLRDYLPELKAMGWVEDGKSCEKKPAQETLCLKKSVEVSNFFRDSSKSYSASIVRLKGPEAKVNILVHELNANSSRSVDKLSAELETVFE